MDELFLDNRTAGLIIKFLQEEITETEHQELQAWVGSSDRAREIFEELTSEEKLPVEVSHFADSRKRILEKIRAAEPETRVVVEMKRGFKWKAWLAAAVVVIVSVVGFFFLRPAPEAEVVNVEQENDRYKNDIPPGGDKAFLQLGDGTIISLDNSAKGLLAKQGNIAINNKSGELIYSADKNNSDETVYINKITTEKGGRYRLTLADGTQVWLNAMSTIYFPARFAGKNREVEISGEVYFEVAKNSKMPFIVKYNDMRIEVTGTEFNLKAYNDESVKTTLIEGSVKVLNGKNEVKLKPGQQAELTEQNDFTVKSRVNVDDVIAWKEGKFTFTDADIKNIMAQLQRWYDIEVSYQNGVSTNFSATNISRDLPISELLKLFEETNKVHFKIEGRKVVVIP
jgi:transmembrane sensor